MNVLDLILRFRSVELLSSYLAMSTFPLHRPDFFDAWKEDVDLARRLVASPKFRSLSECADGIDLPSYRYEPAFVAWLQSLPIACLRITASEWRQDRRTRQWAPLPPVDVSLSASIHRAQVPTASPTPKTGKKRPRDPSSASEIDADAQPPARKRHRTDSHDAFVRSDLWTISSALPPVRSWIEVIESTLMEQDPYLPSDWIHGLLVDVLLGPEYTT